MLKPKPKTSTLDKMSNEDLDMVNRLVLACSSLYYKTSHPSKPGPHTNPNEVDNAKLKVLLLATRVGERVWYPRGKR